MLKLIIVVYISKPSKKQNSFDGFKIINKLFQRETNGFADIFSICILLAGMFCLTKSERRAHNRFANCF